MYVVKRRSSSVVVRTCRRAITGTF
jgi:hypothetical protein